MAKTINLPTLDMRAELKPGSWNEDQYTIDVTWSTGARVRRCPWFDEPYDEELVLSAETVRLERMNRGMSVIADHYGSTGNVVGRVVPGSAKILSEREATCRVQLTKAEGSADLVTKIREGIVNKTSIGYRVYKYLTTEQPQGDGVKLCRAVDWEPFELSLVAIPADAGAEVRSDPAGRMETNSCTLIEAATPASGEVRTMEPTTATPAPTPAPVEQARVQTPAQPAATAAPVETAATREAAVVAERQRTSEIMTLARRYRMPDDFATRMVAGGQTLDQVRQEILETQVRAQDAQAPTASGVRVVREEGAHYREAMEHVLFSRAFPSHPSLTQTPAQLVEAARAFQNMTLLRMAEALLARDGKSVLGSKMQLVERAFHATSDFPLILANTASKSLRQQYEAEPRTWSDFVRMGTLPDFKSMSRTQLGAAPNVDEVPEGGEFQLGTLGEGAEAYRLLTYGKRLGITRQAIINDDLQAFTRIPSLMGAACARKQNDLVWNIINANAAMSDAIALFHASHGNLITPVLALTALTTARTAFRKQTGLAGELLNIEPRYILVPPELETLAWQLCVGQIVPNQASVTNPFTGAFKPIVEPRLSNAVNGSATAWYLMASPGTIDTIEAAYLEGESGPVVEQRVGFEVDGMEIKVRCDFGTKAIDWRGMLKSSGTT